MTGQQGRWQGNHINSSDKGRGRADLIMAMIIADKHNSALKAPMGCHRHGNYEEKGAIGMKIKIRSHLSYFIHVSSQIL